MKFRLPLVVTVSKKIVSSKSGSPKEFNIIEGYAPGLGIFKHFIDEKYVPDVLEGEQVNALFSIYIDRSLNFSLKFEGFEKGV